MRTIIIVCFVLLGLSIAVIIGVVRPPALQEMMDKDKEPRTLGKIVQAEDRKFNQKKQSAQPPQKQLTSREKITPAYHTSLNGGHSASINQFEPNEVVIVNPPPDFDKSIQGSGFKITERIALPGLDLTLFRLKSPTGINVPNAIQQLKGKFPGLKIDANHHYGASANHSDSMRSHARALMGWAEASANCGAGLKIGMIDTGVDLNHPALKGQKVHHKSFHRPGRRPGPNVHGTSVASIIVGRPDWGGLVPGADLYAANMFETKTSGVKVGTVIGLLKSLDWLVRNKVHAINMSIAGADNKILRAAQAMAGTKGFILVAAAGNGGAKAPPAYPAAYAGVVAVTAVRANKEVYSHANHGNYIEFAAPGVGIWTAIPGGGKFQNGTSFASPYIAVLIAEEVAKDGSVSLTGLRRTLKKATQDLGAKGHDKTFGWGLVAKEPVCKP